MLISVISPIALVGVALALHPGELSSGHFDVQRGPYSRFSGPALYNLRARTLNGLTDDESDLIIRAARGGGAHSAVQLGNSALHVAHGLGKGVDRASNVAGNFGSAVSGVQDVYNMFKGFRRDLDDADFDLNLQTRDELDHELYVRAARGTARGAGAGARSAVHAAAAVGKGINSASNVAGNIGTAMTGVSDIYNMFKGGKHRRDLDDIDLELLAREEIEMED